MAMPKVITKKLTKKELKAIEKSLAHLCRYCGGTGTDVHTCAMVGGGRYTEVRDCEYCDGTGKKKT